MKAPIDRLNGCVSHYTTANATVKVHSPMMMFAVPGASFAAVMMPWGAIGAD